MKSLRAQITVSYFVLVTITVAISGFAAMQFSKLSSSIGRILRENYWSVLAAENMVKALERQEAAQLAMQFSDLREGRAAFLEARDEFFRWYEEGLAGAVLPQEPILLDSISAVYDSYLSASDSLYRLVQLGIPGAPEAYRDRVVRPLVSRLQAHNFRLLEVNQNAILATQRRVETAGSAAAQAVIAASALAVLLSLLAAIRFTHRIVRPIGTLTDTVRRVGRGHYGQKVDVTSDDEIAELEREFNKMSERLQAYEALNVQQLIAEKKKTESLIQTMPSPVIVTDPQDRVLLLNRAAVELLGASGRSWRERSLEEVTRNEALLRHLSAPAADGTDPVISIPADGDVCYFRRRRVPVRNAEGQAELTVTMLEDVTRFKELDQLKSEFLAAVSHELRTPLTSVGMAIDILLQEITGPLHEMQRDLLETMRDDAARLKRLVSSLLNLARLESGAYRPAQEPIRLSEIVADAVAPLQLPFREKGVQLENRVPAELPPATGDAEHLGWVVTNLVGNALRHTPEGGTVCLNAHAADGELHLEVADTGPGIPASALETIFEKFVQLKAPNQSTPGSVGLGLALARRVVEAHGGRIWAESAPGKGSTFHVTLPLR